MEAQTSDGVLGLNLRRKDFSRVSLSVMYTLTFDMETRWPWTNRLPTGFDPAWTLEAGKDPGLGIRALHQQGLAGKSVGVAPEATLYYFAVPDNRQNMANYAAAMEQLLALNETLSPAERIRILSVSDGFVHEETGDPEIARWIEMIEKAEAQGILVIHNGSNFPFRYSVAGAEPGRDRNDPESYTPWLSMQRVNRRMPADRVLVPADYRTTAANDSDSAYANWGDGGISWGIP